MKNTTLACSLCFIQEKTVYAILEHHHEDHLVKFLNEKKITLKNFFTRSSANELYACEDNSVRHNVYKIATLLESPVKIYSHREFRLINGRGKTCLWKKYILVYFDS